MAISKTFLIEVPFMVDEEDADIMDKLVAAHNNGRLAAIAVQGILHGFSIDGYTSIGRAILARQGKTYGRGYNGDHVDRDAGNNLRSNLRVVTTSQNQRNRTNTSSQPSSYVGITWDKKANRWKAQVVAVIDGKTKRVFSHNEREAIDAVIYYDIKVRELNLPNARNFTDDELARLIQERSAHGETKTSRVGENPERSKGSVHEGSSGYEANVQRST